MEPAAPEPSRAGPPPPEVIIRTDSGSYVARDLDEARKWVLQGRLLREDLVSHAGGPEVRADAHPLTQGFFELLDEHEADESGTATAEGEEAPATEGTEGGTQESTQEGTEESTQESTQESPAGPLPASIRAIGILDLILSVVPTLNPVGIVAAIGLLRARTWGRALTILWAVITLLVMGFAASHALRSPASLDAMRELAPTLPWDRLVAAGAALGAALAVYLLVVIATLTRRRTAERFRGGGAGAAVLLALLFYLAVGGVIATGALKDRFSRLKPHPVAPQLPPRPRVTRVFPAPAPAPPPPPAEMTEGRAFTADGLASLEVASGWRVRKVTEGESAKLGLLLEGERTVPLGTMRLITASPADLERQDQRFDVVDTKRGDIKDVEVVRRGDFTGRKVVTAFPVPGGNTGYLTLSLHDADQGYQFRCGARGPQFEIIRPECERMAASVLVSNRSAAPASPTASQTAAPASAPSQAAPPSQGAAPEPIGSAPAASAATPPAAPGTPPPAAR